MAGDTAYEDATQRMEVNKEAKNKLLGSAFDTVDSIVNRMKKEKPLGHCRLLCWTQSQPPDPQPHSGPRYPPPGPAHRLTEPERY